MMDSGLATSVMLGLKLLVVVLVNRGFGCIDRLQRATGGPGFNNLLDDARHAQPAQVDFAAPARSLGAQASHVTGVAQIGRPSCRERECWNVQISRVSVP